MRCGDTHTFFSIAVGGGKLPSYDYSGFKVIVFDEIYMSSPFILNKIRKFVEEHPDLIIIGAGDVKQLPSIEPYHQLSERRGLHG